MAEPSEMMSVEDTSVGPPFSPPAANPPIARLARRTTVDSEALHGEESAHHDSVQRARQTPLAEQQHAQHGSVQSHVEEPGAPTQSAAAPSVQGGGTSDMAVEPVALYTSKAGPHSGSAGTAQAPAGSQSEAAAPVTSGPAGVQAEAHGAYSAAASQVGLIWAHICMRAYS